MKPHSTFVRRRFLERCGSVCALCALLAVPAFGQNGDDGAEVSVTDYGTVDLAVQDTDLAQVLQMLAIQSKKNIIASKSVSATVTANLFDVTFEEALDAILRVNGYGWVEEGNFIYVYTQEEIAALEEARRSTESRMFEVQHLSAADAMEFIAPLLSDVGQSSYRGDVVAGFKPDVGDGGSDSYAWPSKLVVNDYPENLDEIGQMLADLDTAPDQVLVESTIVATSLDESNAFGVDFSIIADMDFSDLTDPLSAVNDLINGSEGGFQPDDNKARSITSSVGNTGGPGGLKVGVVSNDVSVFVRLLDEVSDTTVLARPKVMALNRQRAEVLVGARVGYLSTTATETTTTQTVEFLDTGIQLIFRPFISRDGSIRLELAPSVSEASLRTITDSGGALVTIPDELTNELTTNVRVQDGETLVLGGLFRESTTIARRQTPFLGDLPLLGAAFRGQDDTIDRQEIIFLITPSVVQDETLWEMGEDTLAYADRIRVGRRNGLLVFSRDKRTNAMNRDAMDAFNRGDTEMALYHANNSLRMNQHQAEMIKLRERITGARERAYERAILERILRQELGPLFPDQEMQDASARMSVPMRPIGYEPAFEATDESTAPVVGWEIVDYVEESAVPADEMDDAWPMDEAAMDETSMDETSMDETSMDETSMDEMSMDEMSMDETSMDETSMDETSFDQPVDDSFEPATDTEETTSVFEDEPMSAAPHDPFEGLGLFGLWRPGFVTGYGHLYEDTASSGIDGMTGSVESTTNELD
jgi:type IV pilus assembly protein PilQ